MAQDSNSNRAIPPGEGSDLTPEILHMIFVQDLMEEIEIEFGDWGEPISPEDPEYFGPLFSN